MKNKKPSNKTKFSLKKILTFCLFFGFGFVLIGLLTIFLDIKISIYNTCHRAQEKYQNTCPLSLISLLTNPNESFHDKNDAIWTLGRLRSKESLNTLQSLYTGIIPDREPYNGVISQYEIRKALLRIDSNIDVSPRKERTLQKKLSECLPKSDMGSKQTCDNLIKEITNFTLCADAGFPIQETYPERCILPDGRSFTKIK